MTEALIHGGIVLVGIVAYAVLTALGDDGNPALSAALAWAGGAATQAKVAKGGNG